jgi:hypothetical protein
MFEPGSGCPVMNRLVLTLMAVLAPFMAVSEGGEREERRRTRQCATREEEEANEPSIQYNAIQYNTI